jgi:hypothetical protein
MDDNAITVKNVYKNLVRKNKIQYYDIKFTV